MPPRRPALLAGTLALLAALPLAMTINAVHQHNADSPERAVMRTGLMLVLLLVAAPAVVAMRKRGDTTPGDLGLSLVAAAAIVLAGVYLFTVSSSVLVRADTLIWSEGPFVSDIMKFRIGYPLYTAPANLESFFYPPGAQLLTYAIARLTGFATSVPAYRVIQLAYAGAASVLAAAATMRLLALARPGRAAAISPWWGAFWVPFLFLCATNAQTNPFAHALHNDGLSVLVTSAAYFLLVEYAATRRLGILVLLGLLPAAGFYVKQSLVIWAALVTGYLVVFDQPRSLRRATLYAIGAFGLAAAGYGAGRWAWGPDFHYWVIEDLGNHPFSPLRSVQHALSAWVWFAAGTASALLLFGRAWRGIVGLWIVWLLLLAQEAWTSGIAWMLNHMGPGSLLAGAWFAAALAAAWPRSGARPRTVLAWSRAGLVTAGTLLCFSGLGMVRVPVPVLPPDLDRYVSAIEQEFAGMNPARVLLDAGTWVYLPAQVVMKDRSAAVGDLGYSGLGDFSGILARIRGRSYQRILVRSWGTRDFGYDHYLWRHSSGIRAALEENYREVRRIPAVTGQEAGTPFLREISVLEPRP